MSTLRIYQSNDKKAIYAAWKQAPSILYQLPTGGGKSVILSSIIEDYKSENILIFAHKRKLLKQMKGHLNSRGIQCGLLAGTLQENLEANIIIVSIRTAVKDARLEQLLQRDWNKVFIDEARHSRTASYDKVLEALKQAHPLCKMLGVDATPYRKDKKRLDKHFHTLVVSEESTASLTEKGFLQKCKTIVSPINKEALEAQVQETTGDYQITSLSNYMRQPKYINYVVSQYITYGEQRQNIVFAVDKAHSKDLQQAFEDNGYEGKVARIDSSMNDSEIEQAYIDFESGKIQHLINVEMITEGVDLPDCGCITGARPTKSLTLYLQMAGRGTRPDGSNDHFILLDCCGWTEEWGVITSPKSWSLNPEVDPNSGRTGNKVFGRTAAGELVEDLTDYIGEIEELTPEQFLQQLQGGKEKAQVINLTIDQKIIAIYQQIEKMFTPILTKLKVEKDFDATYEYHAWRNKKIIWTCNHETTSRWEKNTIELQFRNDQNHFIALENTSKNNLKSYYLTLSLAGGLGQELLNIFDAGKHKHIDELLAQVDHLLKQKINLEQFAQAEEQMKESQWKAAVEDHAKLDGTFTCVDHLDWDDLFPKDRMHGGKITAITLPNKKINNHHNTVALQVLYNGAYDYSTRKYEKLTKTVEKQYIKGDKLIEMIRDSKSIVIE